MKVSDKLQKIMDKMNSGYGASTRPVEGQVYTIGDSGLVPVKQGVLKIQANQVYSMGASTSPDQIFVTKAPDKDGVFYFKNYPFGKSRERRGDVKYLEDLILQGTKQELKDLQSYQWQNSYTRDRISRLKVLLANKKAHPVDIKDFDRFEVFVTVTDGKDHWRDAERYGNVAGMWKKEEDLGKYLAISDVLRSTLQMLKRDRRFKITKIKRDEY